MRRRRRGTLRPLLPRRWVVVWLVVVWLVVVWWVVVGVGGWCVGGGIGVRVCVVGAYVGGWWQEHTTTNVNSTPLQLVSTAHHCSWCTLLCPGLSAQAGVGGG